MLQDSQQLALMQLSDSFFPSGTYTLSHGLESLVQDGLITSVKEFREMLELALFQKIGPSELVALMHTHQASKEGNFSAISQIENLLWSQTLVEETRESLTRSGRALLRVANSVWSDTQLQELSLPEADFHFLHPIIFAIVGRAAGLDEKNTGLSYLHGFVTGLMGAAIRLGILGHIQAQQLRLDLAPSMGMLCEQAGQTSLEQMGSFAPLLDIAQIEQHFLPYRSFAS